MNKTRIELIRNNAVVNIVEPNWTNESDDFEMSTSSSVSSFPTFFINSSNAEINSLFMEFSQLDIVRLSASSLPTNLYITIFEGEFRKKSTKVETKPDKLTLEIEAIHSFFRLSILELSSTQDFKDITFQEFVSTLVDVAGINSTITIDENLSKTKITGVYKNTNAFRLFKEVCLIIDAAVTFNTDNTVDIDYRVNRLNKIKSQKVQTFTRENIISMESTDSI